MTELGVKYRSVCVGSKMRHMPAAAAVRQWSLEVKEMNLSEGSFGVWVAEGVEHRGLHSRLSHQRRHWLLALDCTNAFDMVKKAVVFEKVGV